MSEHTLFQSKYNDAVSYCSVCGGAFHTDIVLNAKGCQGIKIWDFYDKQVKLDGLVDTNPINDNNGFRVVALF